MSKTTPETMRAAVVDGGKGPAEALRIGTIPTPVPKPGEILAGGAGGRREPTGPAAAHGELSASARRAGDAGPGGRRQGRPGAGRWQPGDRVCALLGGGGYAEYAACDARHVLPLPNGLDFVEAAGLPETFFTVYANVFEHGALKGGETFLVHGATSGIGVTAIQMAKAAGAKVIATGRGAAKAAAAKALGADVAIDTCCEDFAEVCQREGGVDIVLDMVGGDYFRRELDVLRPVAGLFSSTAWAGAQGVPTTKSHVVSFSEPSPRRDAA